MNTLPLPSAMLAIVDANVSDYDDVVRAAESEGIKVHFLRTGNEAMHFARRQQAGSWLINTRLQDMSGFDLAAMLRVAGQRVRVFMVSNEYSVDDELHTLTLGLAKHVCKPVEPSWIVAGGTILPMVPQERRPAA